MDSKFKPFIEFSSDDQQQNAPHLTLKMRPAHSRPELSTTLPYYINFTIHRPQTSQEEEEEEEEEEEPCILRWSADLNGFSRASFVLLRQDTNGSFEKVDVDVQERPDFVEETKISLDKYNSHRIHQLKVGDSVTFRAILPESYQKPLVPGERYHLIWPGGEIDMWDWGTLQEHIGKTIKSRSAREDASELPRLILPACEGISFLAKEELEAWPDRADAESNRGFRNANREEQEWRMAMDRKRAVSPPGIQPSERVPGLPVLAVTLECASEFKLGQPIPITVKVAYESPDPANARPIIFHKYAFLNVHTQREGYRLYCQRHQNDKWEKFEEDKTTGFSIVDNPDVPINVVNDEHFQCLLPGESWSHQEHLITQSGWVEYPDLNNAQRGDKLRFLFKGTHVEWWDWGSAEEHSNTVVKLPCWLAGPVVDPKDNGGRPELIVSSSEPVEFLLV